MKITPQTTFVNLPIDSSHLRTHGLIQIGLAGLFLFLHNPLIPPGLFWPLAFMMLGLGCYNYSQHLTVKETLTNLSRDNKFNITPEWIRRNKKNPNSFYLGKGYIWGIECTQVHHQLQNLPILEQIVNLEPQGGGKRYLHNIGIAKEEDKFLELHEHTVIVGTTGVGKTQTMKLLITQIVEKQDAVIIIDPKGDRDLLDGVYRIAVQAGRKKDFQFFSLLHPNVSHSFDVFSDCMRADEIADRLQSVIAETGGAETSDPFLAFCWGIIHATAELMLVTKEKVTPKRLCHALVINPSELYNIGETMHNNSTSERERETLKEALSLYRARVLEHNQDHAAKMTSVLKPLLTVLGRGELGDMLSPEVARIQMTDIINNKRIVYIYLASMTLQRAAATVGKLMVQQIVGHVGKEYGFSKKLNGVHVFVDEFYSVAFPGYIEMLNKARAAGLNLYLGMQTSADIASALGKTGCEQVLGNTTNYICHRILEKFFADSIAERCGEVMVPQITRTRSINAGMDKADHLFKSGSSTRMDMTAAPRISSPKCLHRCPREKSF